MQTKEHFWGRLKGVIGEGKNFNPLYFPNCKSIHTFFVFKPLDLYWVNQEGLIVEVLRSTRSFGVYQHPKAYGVIETSAGYWNDTEAGDYLILPKSLSTQKPANAIVESAFVLPVLLLIVFGFLQLGLALNANLKLTHAAHQSVFVGGITNDNTKAAGTVLDFFGPGEVETSIHSFDGGTKNTISHSSRKQGDIIQISLVYDYPFVAPFLNFTSITLEETASTRISCDNNDAPYTCEE